jgi:hypothetical protein
MINNEKFFYNRDNNEWTLVSKKLGVSNSFVSTIVFDLGEII